MPVARGNNWWPRTSSICNAGCSRPSPVVRCGPAARSAASSAKGISATSETISKRNESHSLAGSPLKRDFVHCDRFHYCRLYSRINSAGISIYQGTPELPGLHANGGYFHGPPAAKCQATEPALTRFHLSISDVPPRPRGRHVWYLFQK